MTPTVHIIDDDPDVLKALTRLLSSAGLAVSTFESPHEFFLRYDPSVPGCIVLDLSLPDMNGLQLQTLLRERGVIHPVIFVTGHGDISSSVRAMKAGAIDFLTKPVDADELLAAVERGIDLDHTMRSRVHERESAQALVATLTPREREVLPHVLAGRLNKQIAADLGTVEKTIKVHRSRLMHKLGARCVADLVRIAAQAEVQAAPTSRDTRGRHVAA